LFLTFYPILSVFPHMRIQALREGMQPVRCVRAHMTLGPMDLKVQNWNGQLYINVLFSGGFKVGGPVPRLKRGALWRRHHTQPTVISTFDQALDTATERYVPETTAW